MSPWFPDRRRVLTTLAALAAAPRADAASGAPPVTVFAAASLRNALDEVDHAYSLASGGVARAAYGASSVMARQIAEGAPADVFVSADVDWMNYLAARGLIARGSRRDILANSLVLIASAGSKVAVTLAPGSNLSAALGGGRLAIGGPDVPAGLYAEAALKALRIWPSVERRLAPAQNVRAALAFVARGEAPLGIVYGTDARIEPAVEVIGVFPASSHPPIVYPAARIAASRNPAADAYLQFLGGPAATTIFRRYGFSAGPGSAQKSKVARP